jgi:hypothetical protein
MFSVADLRCLSRIRISPSRIQGKKDSGSRIRIRIKNLNIFDSKKLFLSSRKNYLGCSSRIRIFSHPGSRIRNPDARVKKEPYPGSGTLLKLTENLANFVNKQVLFHEARDFFVCH